MRRTLVSLAALILLAACAPVPQAGSAAPPPRPVSPLPASMPEEQPPSASPPPPVTTPAAPPLQGADVSLPPPAKDAEGKQDGDVAEKKKEEKPQSRMPKGGTPPSEAVASSSTLSPDVVAGVVRSHMSEVKACYSRALTATADAGGKLILAITIDGHGNVSQTSVSQSTMSADLAQCVSQRARGWVFPPPDGGGTIVVNYPFVFAAN